MAGKCIHCGFVGTNDQMADHAGEMCQDNFGGRMKDNELLEKLEKYNMNVHEI